MWYGSKHLPNISKRSQNKANRLNLRDRLYAFEVPRNRKLPAVKYQFQVPANWKFIVLKGYNDVNDTAYFYVYSSQYFLNFILAQNLKDLTYDLQTRTLTFSKYDSSATYTAFLKVLSQVFIRFSKPFFIKIRFKGKGYYMYKNARNTIAPQFGYAHRVYVYSFANSVRFLSKTKVLIFGLSKRDAFKAGYELYRTRPINIFTGRGVRFARQVVYRKTGKVGAYR